MCSRNQATHTLARGSYPCDVFQREFSKSQRQSKRRSIRRKEDVSQRDSFERALQAASWFPL